jgi:hypothetical protein
MITDFVDKIAHVEIAKARGMMKALEKECPFASERNRKLVYCSALAYELAESLAHLEFMCKGNEIEECLAAVQTSAEVHLKSLKQGENNE